MIKNIEQKADEALESISHIKRADAPPFLFGRIEAKMQQRHAGVWEKLYLWLSKPSIALAALCLFLLVNAGILFWTSQFTPQDRPEFASVDEYNLVSSSYDLENITP